MPGPIIKQGQINMYMKFKQERKTQAMAAAKAGFSVRSAYNIEKRNFKPAANICKHRTRRDPFDKTWNEIIEMLKKDPDLQATTIIDFLERKYSGRYSYKNLRTLQRRIKKWRITSGVEKEVIFRQNHPPGLQGMSDFTSANKLSVTIQGEALPHLLYHFRLPCSGWEHAEVILGGESFTALSESLQNALWSLGGISATHRTDSLSAAHKNCSDKTKEGFTKSYQDLCKHYGMKPTRNNKGVSHENGNFS